MQLAKEFCFQSQMGKELCNTGVLSYYTLKSALVVPSLERRWIQNVFPEKSKDRVSEPLFYNKSNTTSTYTKMRRFSVHIDVFYS